MFADILPILLPFAGFLTVAAVLVWTLRRREQYCQEGMKYCFWCKRKCDFFGLDERQCEPRPSNS